MEALTGTDIHRHCSNSKLEFITFRTLVLYIYICKVMHGVLTLLSKIWHIFEYGITPNPRHWTTPEAQ